MNSSGLLKKISIFLIFFLSFIFLASVIYVKRNFVLIGTNPIAQILFHFIVQIDGADPAIIKGIVLRCVILPLFAALFVTVIIVCEKGLFKRLNDIKAIVFIRKHILLLSLLFLAVSVFVFAHELKAAEYLKEYTSDTSLYEEEYVDASKVDFVFPEKKRNLIYLLLESAETSDYSSNEGGALKYNCIPELYRLANENVTFNGNRGFDVAPGASWTIAAMIAQSSGIPLNIPIGENDFVTSNKFLPGAYSLGEILEKGGYNNELLIGSEAVFSGRKYYYEMHGTNTQRKFHRSQGKNGDECWYFTGDGQTRPNRIYVTEGAIDAVSL